MAGSLNRVQLLGNVGADPESRGLSNGGEVVNLRIATSETWKDRDGNRQERTQWHQIVCWNEPLQKVIMDYVRKGSKIYIEGQLETRKWQDQSGADRYTTEVVMRPFNSVLVLLDRPQGSGDRGQSNHDYDGGRSSGRGRRDEYDQTTDSGTSQGFGFGGGGGNPDDRRRPQPAAFDSDLDDDVPF